MGEGSGDIIIKGGSVHLNFDSNLYQKDSNDPNNHKHDHRKIMRVRVEDESGKPLFDSDDSVPNNSGLKWTVRVSTK
jgi:hypothetical protein